MLGQTLREYEVVSELGSGGYGVVYRAHDTQIKRDVAMKVILPQYANQPEFVANFEAEAHLVAQLEHPHIVPLYSYWRDEQGAFLVMRYIRGGSLRGMLAKQGALPLVQISRIIEQIAEALQVAHDAGVVHRDLKPDNILIDERGNAYLTDFGIAKQLGEDNASATDAIKGTFAYLSPEQIQQTQVSPQTDVYALGIMLYEMLAGKHPYHETPVGMMVMKHLQEILPDIRDERPDLNGDLDDIIQRATEKDPQRRYASAIELAQAFKAAISGTAAVAPMPIVPVQKKKPTTPEARNRFAMLENVRKFWVEGVLENSLHDAAMIDLGMKPESGAVDNPWDTLIRTPSGEERMVDESIAQVFDRMNGKLLILGDPGSGKTTTLLTLARELLRRAEADEAHPLPVVFNLSSWSENQPPLTEWLVEELNSKYQVPRKVAQKWMDDDELLLLLDGLDEVAETVRDACVEAINQYRSEHGFVDVVVCSRIVDYEALAGQLKLNGAIVIQPLDEDQIVSYLDALGSDVAIVRELIARDVQLRELAHSPLMLSIMILAYRGQSASDVPDFDDLESQRQHLFDVYVQRMFDRRVGDAPYTQDETKHYLRWLAGQMQEHILSVFHIEDLQPTWLANREAIQQFPLRVRQMGSIYLSIAWTIALGIFYLVADVSSLAGLPFAIISVTITATIYVFMLTSERTLSDAGQGRWRDYIPVSLAIGVTFSILLVSTQPIGDVLVLFPVIALIGSSTFGVHSRAMRKFGAKPDRIVFTENIQFRWLHYERAMLVDGFLSMFAVVALAYILFPFTIIWDIQVVLIGLLFGFGFTVTGAYILTGFSVGDVSLRSTPNQGLRNTVRAFIQFIVYVGIFTIFFGAGWAAMGLSADRAILAWIGIVIFFSLGDTVISHGGMPITQHLWLRYQLERRGQIPRNMARFLDHASSLILMRKVGGGYIFVHRYLLEYFAELETKGGEVST